MKNKGITLDPKTHDLAISIIRNQGKIEQGLCVGDITEQNACIILYMQPGELKWYPTVGVGIANMLLSHDELYYKQKIRQQLGLEGMLINYLEIKDKKIEIDADYN